MRLIPCDKKMLSPDLLFLKGGEVDCGIEVGSVSTFYSWEDPARGNVSMDERTIFRESDAKHLLRSSVKIGDASFDLSESRTSIDSQGRRILRLEMTEKSALMDVVLRFVAPLAHVRHAYLGKEEIFHRRRNKYYQVPFQDVLFDFVSGSRIRFRPHAECIPAGMQGFVYLRDEPDAWVFHVRLQATRPDVFVFKGCSRFYNKPFPAWIQRLVSSVPGFFRQTLYIRERISQRIPFQTNGAVLLEKGSRVSLSVAWEVQNEA